MKSKTDLPMPLLLFLLIENALDIIEHEVGRFFFWIVMNVRKMNFRLLKYSQSLRLSLTCVEIQKRSKVWRRERETIPLLPFSSEEPLRHPQFFEQLLPALPVLSFFLPDELPFADASILDFPST